MGRGGALIKQPIQNTYLFTRKDFGDSSQSRWHEWATGGFASFNARTRHPMVVAVYAVETQTVELMVSSRWQGIDIVQYLKAFFEHAGITIPFRITSLVTVRNGKIDLEYYLTIEWDGDPTPQNLNEYFYAGIPVEGAL